MLSLLQSTAQLLWHPCHLWGGGGVVSWRCQYLDCIVSSDRMKVIDRLDGNALSLHFPGGKASSRSHKVTDVSTGPPPPNTNQELQPARFPRGGLGRCYSPQIPIAGVHPLSDAGTACLVDPQKHSISGASQVACIGQQRTNTHDLETCSTHGELGRESNVGMDLKRNGERRFVVDS
jgi:hypothetical protein